MATYRRPDGTTYRARFPENWGVDVLVLDPVDVIPKKKTNVGLLFVIGLALNAYM